MKRIFLIFTVICMMFSTGCSSSVSLKNNYRAIEELQLIHTIGFDTHSDGLEFSVCGGEKENQGVTRLSTAEKNISAAYETLQNYSGKEELYFAHTRYVLVGEDYAKEGLEAVMNYLESSKQLRSDLPMFVVRSGTAKELLMKAGGTDHSIFEVMKAAVRECTQTGGSYPFTCGDIAAYSAEYGSALVCSLDIKPTKDIDPFASDDELTPVVAGYGVLKEGKLVGYITEDAAKGINLLIDELGTGDISVNCNGMPMSLRITNADTTLCPSFGDAGTITNLTVQMSVEAILEEANKKRELDLTKVSAGLEQIIEEWINEILMTMRTTGTDFLGFGPQISIRYPSVWENLPVDWITQMKTLPMHADVTCTVTLGENEQRR